MEGMTQKIKEVCRGCILFEDSDLVCPLFTDDVELDNDQFFDVIRSCPCRKCLIKSMCTHACEDFNRYIQIIPQDLKLKITPLEEGFYEKWQDG